MDCRRGCLLKSSHSLLDEGQFGAALVESAFNYERGRQYGGEFTTNYDHGPFSAYGNVGWNGPAGFHGPLRSSCSTGRVQICQESLDFSRSRPAHYRFARRFLHLARLERRFRHPLWQRTSTGFANIKTVPEYSTVNLSLQRNLKIPKIGLFKIRFDVVNLLDNVYELRDGSGIGVGAPQFGQRRGFYGTIAYDF